MLRVILVFIFVLLCASQAKAATTLVSGQTHTVNYTSNTLTWTCSTNSTPTTNNEDVISVFSGKTIPTAPTGWNQISNPLIGSATGYYLYSRVAQAGDPTTVSVTWNAVTEGRCTWFELTGESTLYSFIAGSTQRTATGSPTIAPTATYNVPTSGGLLVEEFGAQNASAVVASMTDSPPSGVTTSQIAFNSQSTGTQYVTIGLYQTTSDPYSATQPYAAYGTFSAAQVDTQSEMIWFPPLSYAPLSFVCQFYVNPCPRP